MDHDSMPVEEPTENPWDIGGQGTLGQLLHASFLRDKMKIEDPMIAMDIDLAIRNHCVLKKHLPERLPGGVTGG